MRLLYLAFPQSAHTLKWINHYKMNNDIMLVCFLPSEQIEGIDLRCLPVRNKNMAVMKLAKVKELIKEFKPDILHAHYASSHGFVAALSGFHPYVLSVWGDDIMAFPNKSPLHRWVVRRALGAADYITATSHILASKTKALIKSNRNIEVIPFGVDLNHYQFKEREDKDIVHIGTVRELTPKYGLEYLINACARLAESGYKAKLTIVGDGILRSKLESLTHKLKIADHVCFAGFIKNQKVVTFLHQFDIFVIPSVEEGETFGVAAVEAMATGLPVIASKIGGLPEVVDHGTTGLHVRPRDVDALADALKMYINSKELRHSHGICGRQKAEKLYNWRENVKRINSIYESAMTKK